MTEQIIREAYDRVLPSEQAKEEILNQILTAAADTTSGKDTMMKGQKTKRVWLAAAVVTIVVGLVGCAAWAMGLKDLSVGKSSRQTYYWDDTGHKVEETVTKDRITLHGFRGTPTYLAHKEWEEFCAEYDQDKQILYASDEDGFERPARYDGYFVYSQEMMDKVDEIAEKYNLNVLGEAAYFQRYESSVFYQATGIDSLLVPESEISLISEGGYFYEAGNFKVYYDMTLPYTDGQWPHEMHNSMYYSQKDNFDTVVFLIDEDDSPTEWYYTTASGAEVLIISTNHGARVFHDREDAVICVTIENFYQYDFNEYTNEYEKLTVMTKEQLEEVVDQIDFSIKVENVDMELAKAKLECFGNP